MYFDFTTQLSNLLSIPPSQKLVKSPSKFSLDLTGDTINAAVRVSFTPQAQPGRTVTKKNLDNRPTRMSPGLSLTIASHFRFSITTPPSHGICFAFVLSISDLPRKKETKKTVDKSIIPI